MANRVGILGGGQLARMTAEAAADLGVEIFILESEAGSPAGQIVGADHEIVGTWRKLDDARALAERVDLITLENEFVDADLLAALVEAGTPVLPGPETLRIIQDKLLQKQTLAARGLPVPAFRPVASEIELLAAGHDLGWPLVLKARRLGYDGHGNATVNGPTEASAAIARLAGPGAPAPLDLYAEGFVPFAGELAMMVARGRDGACVAYPLAETVQRDHICHEVVVPARVPEAVASRARKIALAAVDAADAVGVVGVELFLLTDGEILVNELAPRPHNSGHYTIEACETSQFGNHLRAVLGRELGSPDLVAPGAAMVNLLGTRQAPAAPGGIAQAERVPRAFLHLYGKREVRPGRKMGHVTALGESPEAALAAARRAANFIEW
ncbi:MAG TPA: 5-(carboxyamino)imidazole ribonucleotide synthase [Chloroflexota bacterium]|nr:5-(carboxyamino)imidazole ribonucleotide synthase [Chloroflexota bacterium]